MVPCPWASPPRPVSSSRRSGSLTTPTPPTKRPDPVPTTPLAQNKTKPSSNDQMLQRRLTTATTSPRIAMPRNTSSSPSWPSVPWRFSCRKRPFTWWWLTGRISLIRFSIRWRCSCIPLKHCWIRCCSPGRWMTCERLYEDYAAPFNEAIWLLLPPNSNSGKSSKRKFKTFSKKFQNLVFITHTYMFKNLFFLVSTAIDQRDYRLAFDHTSQSSHFSIKIINKSRPKKEINKKNPQSHFRTARNIKDFDEKKEQTLKSLAYSVPIRRAKPHERKTLDALGRCNQEG